MRRRRPWLALAALGALGCGALFPKAATSDFFLLTGLEPVATATPAAPAPTILLGPVTLPAYLDRPELVTRLASNQLRVEELEQWAEPLRESVPRTLQRDLAALLGSGRLQRQPWTAPSPPELVVSVEVVRFEKTAARTVDLAARWMICVASAREGCLRRETRLSHTVSDTSTQAAVASMSEALAMLSREIVKGIRGLGAPATASPISAGPPAPRSGTEARQSPAPARPP